jgi:hypothetical protein
MGWFLALKVGGGSYDTRRRLLDALLVDALASGVGETARSGSRE